MQSSAHRQAATLARRCQLQVFAIEIAIALLFFSPCHLPLAEAVRQPDANNTSSVPHHGDLLSVRNAPITCVAAVKILTAVQPHLA